MATALATALVRQSLMRRFERRMQARFTWNDDGEIRGAEAIQRGNGGAAALILHGFGDTPQSVSDLAEHLAARGWRVRVPLLPGHGRTLREFASTRASEWLACARAECAALVEKHGRVTMIGQSMGGALATIIAAEQPGVVALVLLAPYFNMPPRIERLTHWPRLISVLTPYVRDRSSISIWDPIARQQSLGFGVTPVRTLPELRRITRLAWNAAPRVTVPTLMLHSSGDNRISVADADRAFQQLGARERRFVRLDGCGHVIAVDSCKAAVFAETARWLERWMPNASVTPG